MYLIAAILRQSRAELKSNACTCKGEPIGFHKSAGFLPLLALLLRFKPIEAIFTRTSLGTLFSRSDGKHIV